MTYCYNILLLTTSAFPLLYHGQLALYAELQTLKIQLKPSEVKFLQFSSQSI